MLHAQFWEAPTKVMNEHFDSLVGAWHMAHVAFFRDRNGHLGACILETTQSPTKQLSNIVLNLSFFAFLFTNVAWLKLKFELERNNRSFERLWQPSLIQLCLTSSILKGLHPFFENVFNLFFSLRMKYKLKASLKMLSRNWVLPCLAFCEIPKIAPSFPTKKKR